MKKILFVLMALVMSFATLSCEEQKPQPTTEDAVKPNVISKEEMLQKAVEMDDYQTAMTENLVRAEAKYVNNIFYVTDMVSDINKEHLNVGDFKVSLPTEDILQLENGQWITVVGKIDSISYTPGVAAPDEFSGVMSNAYLVTDVFEITGYMEFHYIPEIDVNGKYRDRRGEEDAWELGLKHSTETRILTHHFEESVPVTHVKDHDILSVQFDGQDLLCNTKITVSGKMFGSNRYIRDAKLVSVEK